MSLLRFLFGNATIEFNTDDTPPKKDKSPKYPKRFTQFGACPMCGGNNLEMPKARVVNCHDCSQRWKFDGGFTSVKWRAIGGQTKTCAEWRKTSP